MALTHQPNVTASPPQESDSDDGKEVQEQELPLAEEKEGQQRKIGKWFIKETLGKGGYSWVKRGVDCNTERVYALKFMERRKGKDGKLRKSQIKQVCME